MEGSGTEETKMGDSRLTSAAAFVEGGIQDACDDACSICLEEFCDSDPSTVTTCKHEFHLQCILEWCQRSAQCPMCWQAISLKDPSSQELLEAVEHERSIRSNPPRNATIFHHPTLGNFELQHLPVGSNDAELEERIIQHLAAAAAMGRAHHFARREGQRSRSTSQGRPQFLVFSSHPNAPPAASLSSSPAQREGDSDPASEVVVNPSAGEPAQGIPQLLSSQTDQISASTSRSSGQLQHGISFSNRSSASHTSQVNHDRAGPSELQSFSESLKSRLNSVSMRYKESITKSTRGWKDRLFSRSTSMADIGSEVKREVNAGIASVSRLMERLETRENIRPTGSSMSNNSVTETVSQTGTHGNNHPNDTSASCAASSGQT